MWAKRTRIWPTQWRDVQQMPSRPLQKSLCCSPALVFGHAWPILRRGSPAARVLPQAASPDFSPQVRTALRYRVLLAALHLMQRGVVGSKVRQHRREACATTSCGAGGFLITVLPW